MNFHFLYLIVNISAFFFPFILSFDKKVNFYKTWPYLLKANVIVALVFLIWDYTFNRLGIWGFNDKYIVGIRFLKLPLEELMWFFIVPYCCFFVYECVRIRTSWKLSDVATKYVNIIIIVASFLVGIFNLPKLYTSITFLSLALVLIYLHVKKNAWLSVFWPAYLIILIPLFLMNGILTGYGIPEEIVWYNNAHNLSIRIFTIPIEDFFYGLLLVLLLVALIEKFRGRASKTSSRFK